MLQLGSKMNSWHIVTVWYYPAGVGDNWYLYSSNSETFAKYEDSNCYHQQTQTQRPKGVDIFELSPAITDPITKKDHAFETLGIYLWDKPRNDIEKEFNKQAMLWVEGIKAQLIISIIDNEFDFFDAKKRSGDFLLFFSEFCIGRPPMYRI